MDYQAVAAACNTVQQLAQVLATQSGDGKGGDEPVLDEAGRKKALEVVDAALTRLQAELEQE